MDFFFNFWGVKKCQKFVYDQLRFLWLFLSKQNPSFPTGKRTPFQISKPVQLRVGREHPSLAVRRCKYWRHRRLYKKYTLAIDICGFGENGASALKGCYLNDLLQRKQSRLSNTRSLFFSCPKCYSWLLVYLFLCFVLLLFSFWNRPKSAKEALILTFSGECES